MSDHDTNLSQLTTGIVAAYVENNELAIQHLPDLIRSVHHALGSLGAASETPAPAATTTTAQIRRSITAAIMPFANRAESGIVGGSNEACHVVRSLRPALPR